MAILNKIALGTAQFGMTYGVANSSGSLSGEGRREIISYAREKGIRVLDTAVAYGESESRLGNIGVMDFQIVSKLPMMPKPCADVFLWASNALLASLKRLNINKLHGLLLHKPDDLLGAGGRELYCTLLELRRAGYVEKIGISIYHPNELELLCSNFDFDLIQAPFNILDRRLKESGWLSRLAKKKIEVHVRSVFLQGLLLMRKDLRPEKFARWGSLWAIFHDWLDSNEMTALQACLKYVLSFPEIDKVVIGVDSLSHLKQCLELNWREILPVPTDLYCDDLNLLNPSNWGAL